MASLYEEQRELQVPLSTSLAFDEEQRELRQFARGILQKAVQPPVQTFTSGATRSSDAGKNEYEGFLHPGVLELFGNYMTKHRVQPDGALRAPDNWQKGIPLESYQKSFVRHAIELWMLFRGVTPARIEREMPLATHEERLLETACAILFNVQGYLFERFVKPKLRGVNPS